MLKRPKKTVLFLCTGNYYRSRFAEILFNHVAGKFGLPWKASSRGLALERGLAQASRPISVITTTALEGMGVRAKEEVARFPLSVTHDELNQADFIVALKDTEHRPLLQDRFPLSVEKVEFWEVDDDPAVLDLIEREVTDLISRLISGGKRSESQNHQVEAAKASAPNTTAAKANGSMVRVGRETKGRRGKGVTTVWDARSMKMDCRNLRPSSSRPAARVVPPKMGESKSKAISVSELPRRWKEWDSR